MGWPKEALVCARRYRFATFGKIFAGERACPFQSAAPEVELAEALRAAGLQIDGLPVMNGKIQRVPSVDGKPGNRDGYYCAYSDGRPAGWYMNYRTGGEKITWVATGHMLTEEQKATLQIEASQRLAEREAERKAAYAEASRRCLDKISLADGYPALKADSNHLYLIKKGVENFGLPIDGNGNLLVPGINLRGSYIPHLALQTVQSITPDGQKFFEPGSQKAGAMFLISNQFIDMSRKKMESPPLLKALEPEDEILISEGYAIGASLHLATGLPVVVAFDAGNLKAVAQSVRETFPESDITICADNDYKLDNNVGLERAREAAREVNGGIACPEFNHDEREKALTDFNDLHQSRGLEAVAASFGRKQVFTLDQADSKQKNVFLSSAKENLGLGQKNRSEGMSR